ncbi:MAG: PEGA domain-containing protein [Alphaproteobacteria bacterium]
MKKYLIFAWSLLLSGCGTIFSGTQQSVTINSNVQEAKVYVNGMPSCTTPCAVNLKRASSNAFIILKKEGYIDVTAPLVSEINPISIINLSNPYSWTTDYLSGGVWRYSPDAVYVEMGKEANDASRTGAVQKSV